MNFPISETLTIIAAGLAAIVCGWLGLRQKESAK